MAFPLFFGSNIEFNNKNNSKTSFVISRFKCFIIGKPLQHLPSSGVFLGVFFPFPYSPDAECDEQKSNKFSQLLPPASSDPPRGVRGSRCAEELKPCRANVWSPFHRRMSQHDQRDPLDRSQTPLMPVRVCACTWTLT